MTTSLKQSEKKCSFMDASCLQRQFREHHSDEQFPQGTTHDCNPFVLVAVSTVSDKSNLGGGQGTYFVHFQKCQEKFVEAEQFTSGQTKVQRERITADFLLPHTPSWAPVYGMQLLGQGNLP